MPSSRPCAAFEPISPDFDLQALVDSAPNFEWVVRIDCEAIEHNSLQSFEELILRHVIVGGKPLVIQGYQHRFDRELFSEKWLRDNCGSEVVDVRDLTKQTNVPMTMAHYLRHMGQLTNQWTLHNFKDGRRQRMYLKDIDCPKQWQDSIRSVIPPPLFYLNGNTSQSTEWNSIDTSRAGGGQQHSGHILSPAGDLMSSLPTSMRADNLMCYIGHEGTYTPCHREMCASLGQNIMVEASTGAIEDGIPTHPGSSIWFMTETKEREVVSEYWLSCLGHDVDIESHFAQTNAWKNAPFKTYVVEQVPGDFILVPPLAPHQVWNRGTRTMKIAWNRTTVETLELALSEALPKARMVCRDEQYKNKAIIYYTLKKYSKLMENVDTHQEQIVESLNIDFNAAMEGFYQIVQDFEKLLSLFTQLLVAESFIPNQEKEEVEMISFDGNITCSYCRCNIFNRFLTCPSCIRELDDGDQDTYDICLDCYATGRSCACIAKLRWVEQFKWDDLVRRHEKWRQLLVKFVDQEKGELFIPFAHELNNLGSKRSLAQICQLELSRRPWRDVSKPDPAQKRIEPEDGSEGSEADNAGKKKRKFEPSEKFSHEHGRCHLDNRWEPKWKQAICTFCGKSFCYGNLFRGYDTLPAEIMADPNWECPSCRNICGCRHCRTKPGYTKYVPHSTFLGHKTKSIADARSVESLVDFSTSNILWIRKAGDDHEAEDTQRMERYRRKAEDAKLRDLNLEDACREDTFLTTKNTVQQPHPRVVEPADLLDPALATIDTQTSSKFSGPLNDPVEEIQESPMLTSFPLDEGCNFQTSQVANEHNSTELVDEIGMIIRKRKRTSFHETEDLHQAKQTTVRLRENRANNLVNNPQTILANTHKSKALELGTNENYVMDDESTTNMSFGSLHYSTPEPQLATSSSNNANTNTDNVVEGIESTARVLSGSLESNVLATNSASTTSSRNSEMQAGEPNTDLDGASISRNQLDGSNDDSKGLRGEHNLSITPIDVPDQSMDLACGIAEKPLMYSLTLRKDSTTSSSKSSPRGSIPVRKKTPNALQNTTSVPAQLLKPLIIPKASTLDWDDSSDDEILPKSSIRSRVATSRPSVVTRDFRLQVNNSRANGAKPHRYSGERVSPR